ncbi:MAG: hypothetical protein H0W23_08505 [Chloroflexia bacterium]|nr:hypothetical protein [Chloroflexia bacterium]
MLDVLNIRLMSFLRIAALAIVVGLFSASPVYAQDDAATEVADTASEVTDVAEDEDDGFDWGLLGLLGLLGLGGLLKKNDTTHTTTRVDRDVDTARR